MFGPHTIPLASASRCHQHLFCPPAHSKEVLPNVSLSIPNQNTLTENVLLMQSVSDQIIIAPISSKLGRK